MTLKEIERKLAALRAKGFVVSARRGATGIGYTLEQELGLGETNLAIPDIGGRVELKATRRNSDSLVTLFTFNRAIWQLPQKEVIENYGYVDSQGRQALYSTVFYGQQNSQNLSIKLDKINNNVHLFHDGNVLLATWSIFTIVGKFISKLERLLVVLADSRANENSNREEFCFNEAYILENPSPDKFLSAFENSRIAIDIRMHIKDTGAVRNHGTAFRIMENGISNLYEDKKKIL